MPEAGREIVRMPLGDAAAQRYGAPYWSIHRGDLQAALSSAVAASIDISLQLGVRVEDFVAHDNGVTVLGAGRNGTGTSAAIALIAADGLWSVMRARIGLSRAAALCRAHRLAGVCAGETRRRPNSACRWSICGSAAKPISCTTRSRVARLINIVVIINDEWNAPGWSAPAQRDELLPRLSVERCGAGRRSRLISHAGNLAEMGAVSTAGRC